MTAQAKRTHRPAHAKPITDRFFRWIDKLFESHGFLPSSPVLEAPAYVRKRRAGLEAYLDDPDVAINTNRPDRALRVILMGRPNWLFAWTEVGAKHIGIVQSFLAICWRHDTDS